MEVNFLKIFKSEYSPHGYDPLSHTICPDKIDIETSYLKPGPLNLCPKHFLLKGIGSKILKSVRSTELYEHRICERVFRFSHLIY